MDVGGGGVRASWQHAAVDLSQGHKRLVRLASAIQSLSWDIIFFKTISTSSGCDRSQYCTLLVVVGVGRAVARRGLLFFPQATPWDGERFQTPFCLP